MPETPPAVLAIDTATEVCSVALLSGERLTERIETVGQRHSERVLPMIDAVLSDAQLSLGAVDVFAFGAGPGSFTGLRIACGVAQGLAYGKRKSVLPIGNLRALAARAFDAVAAGNLLLAAIDARMNEAYCALYQRDEPVSEVRAPALESPLALIALAASARADIVAGNALTVFAGSWPIDGAWVALPDITASAASIARLARFDAARGLAVAPERAAPLYVRDQVALTIEERRRRADAAPVHAGERSLGPGAAARSATESH